MHTLIQQFERAHRVFSVAYLDGGICFWMWLIDTIANVIVASITLLVGQIAFLYRMAQMRSAVISFGSWGGLYANGTHAYRVCLGFVAITWLPLDVDAVLADIGTDTPRHFGLSILLSRSDRPIGGYTRYALRAWQDGCAVALLLADIDDIWGSQSERGR